MRSIPAVVLDCHKFVGEKVLNGGMIDVERKIGWSKTYVICQFVLELFRHSNSASNAKLIEDGFWTESLANLIDERSCFADILCIVSRSDGNKYIQLKILSKDVYSAVYKLLEKEYFNDIEI